MCCSDDGKTFSSPIDLEGISDGYWLWSISAYNNTLFGAAYYRNEKGFQVSLYQSANGINWEKMIDFPFPGGETFIDIDSQGTIWALSRDDNYGYLPMLYSINAPYNKFDKIQRLPIRLQGPMIKRLPNGCLIACRCWDYPVRHNTRTDIFWLEDGKEIELLRTLPSGGDTSYAGVIEMGKNRILMSYYSSHEYKMAEPHENDLLLTKDTAYAEHTTNADIFLAEISYK